MLRCTALERVDSITKFVRFSAVDRVAAAANAHILGKPKLQFRSTKSRAQTSEGFGFRCFELYRIVFVSSSFVSFVLLLFALPCLSACLLSFGFWAFGAILVSFAFVVILVFELQRDPNRCRRKVPRDQFNDLNQFPCFEQRLELMS